MKVWRAAIFGIIFWVFVFVIFSVLMFLPSLADKTNTQYIILWILEIPLTIALAKWYFLKVYPSIKHGFLLGLVALLISTILDMAVTVPLFVKDFVGYYTNWHLYIGYALVWLICIWAGGEFDAVDYNQVEKKS
jgi:hypothetical protein